MKRSIRFPFCLLVLIAVFTVLTCHFLLRDGLDSGSRSSRAPPLNETLLRLAVLDPAEDEIRRDVDQLLAGNLPSAATRPRPAYPWRRDSRARLQYPIRRPKDYRIRIQIQIPPEFAGSLRDWHRRRRFQPSIMSELLRLVGARHPYGSCAVVGNSGVLLNHDHGELIDGHDLVIRLNNARVDGYQRHVGSKTGISFINSNILHLCARRSGCYCHPYGASVPIVMYVCQPAHFIDYAICNASRTAPLLITEPAFDLLCAGIAKYYSLKRFGEETAKPLEEWGRSHDEKMFHYSSGLQAVMLALGVCDRVSVFGFGKSADAKHHYHTNQKAELDLHDYAAEYAFYHDLVERPQVIPFLKDSGFKIPPIVFYQ